MAGQASHPTPLRRRATRTQKPRGLGRPPGANAEDTVKRIVQAAQAEFGMHGYSGARMTKIAEAAGITHSSIYQYFASKRDLYEAAFAAALGELLPEYLASATSQTTLRDQIKEIMRASARAHQRSPLITPFLASLPIELRRHPDLLPTLQIQGDSLNASLAEMFTQARQRGEIAADVTDRDLLTGFIGAAMGVGLLSYALPDGDMTAAIEVLLAGLDGTLFHST
ncbi:TetR/AcrR family transcriptional regulator [Mycobacterium sp. E2479]|uniref:TetR/AcrR family transcriptional regulator n=1 Tax=Mycobacterium sp. E2479 TaxID=1834134 RepID=UPI000800252A|nr:TetR/AcrR family transcriptional regulator [Mycobacterium sp. E2479]OBH49268.1 hypothetical protein A5686_15420 [Mycobacterium sp. E2479]